MLNRKRIKKILFPLFLIMLVIAGCSSKVDTSENERGKEEVDGLAPLEKTEKVYIAEDGAASGAGFYIANEKGYFKDFNIDIEFVTFANSDDMLPAVASGKVDVAGGISTAAFFNSLAQGIDVKMIADKGHNIKGKSYFTFVIRKDLTNEIQSYEDFKGKTIAVSTKNGVDDYIFEQMLHHGGLTRDDVEFVLMADFGNMLAAIGNGSIDAALQIEPLVTKGIAENIHERFGDATDYAPEAQIAMVLSSPKFLVDREEVALRFMVAYLKGVRDYNDAFVKGTGDKDEMIDIMTKYTTLKEKEVWKEVNVTGLNPNGEMFIEDIKNQFEVYKANGAIKGDLNFHDSIDTTITERAVEILGEYE